MASGAPNPPPTKALAGKYLSRARQHYQAYLWLKSSGQHLDWAVISLFYTVLNLVEACFVENYTFPTRDHAKRRDRVGGLLTPIWEHYRTLEDKSQEARYDPDHVPFTVEQVQELETLDFAPIVKYLRSHKHGISLDS